MFKKHLFLGFILFAFSTNAFFNTQNTDNAMSLSVLIQDNSVLIKKIKAKIAALDKKKEQLKSLRRWTPAKEKNYQKQLKKYNKTLLKLGDKSQEKLDVDQIIKKLQRQLKYLNNARVNKNARDGMSKKYDSMYKHDAGILLDSIMKLRRRKG